MRTISSKQATLKAPHKPWLIEPTVHRPMGPRPKTPAVAWMAAAFTGPLCQRPARRRPNASATPPSDIPDSPAGLLTISTAHANNSSVWMPSSPPSAQKTLTVWSARAARAAPTPAATASNTSTATTVAAVRSTRRRDVRSSPAIDKAPARATRRCSNPPPDSIANAWACGSSMAAAPSCSNARTDSVSNRSAKTTGAPEPRAGLVWERRLIAP